MRFTRPIGFILLITMSYVYFMVVGSLVGTGVAAMHRQMGAVPAMAKGNGNYGVYRGWFAIGPTMNRDLI